MCFPSATRHALKNGFPVASREIRTSYLPHSLTAVTLLCFFHFTCGLPRFHLTHVANQSTASVLSNDVLPHRKAASARHPTFRIATIPVVRFSAAPRPYQVHLFTSYSSQIAERRSRKAPQTPRGIPWRFEKLRDIALAVSPFIPRTFMSRFLGPLGVPSDEPNSYRANSSRIAPTTAYKPCDKCISL